MGWKSVVRGLEREAKRQIRENERQLRYQQKIEQIEGSKKEVSGFERDVKSLTSFHLKDVNLFDWGEK